MGLCLVGVLCVGGYFAVWPAGLLLVVGIFVVTLVLFCCVACGFGLLWWVLCGWDFSVAGAGGLLILVYSFDVCRFPYLLCFGMLVRLI